ncbi:PLP-dependent aminotransferase family protein [Streptosporangium sp. NPDC006007]|uniref:aminotransferase-like domain-containing protein n=1 Tax=Streptosporangium sp. NPDC006007 TaxID=3154575 RepID=UPI0033A3579F
MADLHLTVDRAAGGIAGQIAHELRQAVRQGRLAAGARLPASRELARDLGLSRGVVVEAYERLVAEGFLISRVGAGTVVAPAAGRPPAVSGHDPAVPARRPYHGRRPTSPDLAAFPRERWLAAIRQALATLPAAALDYGDPGGVPDLREELAAYLRRVRAADVTPDNLVIVGGVAQGLSLTVRTLRGRPPQERTPHAPDRSVTQAPHAPGRSFVQAPHFPERSFVQVAHAPDRLGGWAARSVPPPDPIRLAVEDPTSLRQFPLLRAAGADPVAVPVDEEGVDVDALAACGARAVLLTPAHQYPTGIVLSPRRRAELIEWAAATGATVLEDDYDAEFRFDRDPVGCLQGLAPDRVVLVGSVSKSLAPGLRLGWVAAPPEIAESIRLARAELDLGSPVLEQYALAELIRTGGYDRQLRRMRREYRTRRDALVGALTEHLPEIRVRGVSAGLHLLAELPDGWDEPAVAETAQDCGLAVEPVAPMRYAPGPPALVVGFARLPAHRADETVRTLASRLPRRPC